MRCIRRSQVAGLVVARGMLLRLPRYALITLLYAGVLLSVSACSSSDNATNTNPTPPPPQQSQQQAIATIPPVPTAMDTLRSLAPPDGLKFTPLFSQPLPSNAARITRLEHAVQTLSDDINTMAPTVVRMVAIEGDVKGLVAQLQTLTNQNQQGSTDTNSSNNPQDLPPALPKSARGNKIPEEDVAKGTEPAKAGPAASSSLVTPEAASKGELPPKGAASPISKIQSAIQQQGLDLNVGGKPVAPKAKKAKTKNAVTGSVVNMRIADWPKKTRLVLDVTAKAPIKMHMSKGDQTLVINLKHFHWGGRSTWASDHRKLITGGYVKDGKLYVNLTQPASFKALKLLPPSQSDKNFRLVIDLFKKSPPKTAVTKKVKPQVKTQPPAPPAPTPIVPPNDFP